MCPLPFGWLDNPRTGTLKGTRTESHTWTIGGGGSGISRTITFTVGIYEMDNGEMLAVRCDTYQVWGSPTPE